MSSRSDQEIFIWCHKNQSIDTIACFVNNIIWGGTHYFCNTVIKTIRNTFNIGSESLEAFRYVGLNIIQNTDFSVNLDQTNYTNAINTSVLTNDRMK